MSRQLADNCCWVDNQLSLTTEQMNIPNYHYWVDKHINNCQLGGKNVMP